MKPFNCRQGEFSGLPNNNLLPYRIGVDARYLRRPGVGISRYLHQGIVELLETEAQVTLVTDSEDHGHILRVSYSSCDVVVVPGRSGFRWEQQRLARHLVKAGYDAYVAPSNYGLPLNYRGTTVLILIVHDLIPLKLWHIYLIRRPLWATKYLLSVAIAAACANHIVAPSQATARDIARLLRRREVSVIYPPIPEPASGGGNTCSVGLPVQLLSLNGSGVRRYFIYNGGVDPRKNVPILLRAFRKARLAIPDIDLVVIGPGREHFLRLIEKLGLNDCVHALGYVDETTKYALLKSAVAMFYPSRMEGFGLPVLEAMTVGIPVVCGTGGSLVEVGGDAPTYLGVINEESIAAAMLTVAGDKSHKQARDAAVAQLRVLLNRRGENTLASVIAILLEKRK